MLLCILTRHRITSDMRNFNEENDHIKGSSDMSLVFNAAHNLRSGNIVICYK